MGRRDQRIRESLGYIPGKKEKPDRLMVPFNNKYEKWEYMKNKGLDEAFLALKKVFPSCEEPIVFRKKD
jgi:hypothetical protein